MFTENNVALVYFTCIHLAESVPKIHDNSSMKPTLEIQLTELFVSLVRLLCTRGRHCEQLMDL